jgi:hypothetical protein
MVYEGGIPSDQCKMIIDRSMSTREVDGLSLIFIGLNVPALKPLLHRTEAALQLSENISL